MYFSRNLKENIKERDVHRFGLCVTQCCCGVRQGLFTLPFLTAERGPGSCTRWYNFEQPNSHSGSLNCWRSLRMRWHEELGLRWFDLAMPSPWLLCLPRWGGVWKGEGKACSCRTCPPRTLGDLQAFFAPLKVSSGFSFIAFYQAENTQSYLASVAGEKKRRVL